MRRGLLIVSISLAVAALCLFAPTAYAGHDKPAGAFTDEVKISADGTAKSDGELHFVFTAQGSDPKDIRITVKKGMEDEEVSRDIAKELSVAVGPDYKVDADDDFVKVKAKDKAARFSLTMGSANVTGVGIELK